MNPKKFPIVILLALSGCTGMDVDQRRPTVAKYHDAAWIENDAHAQYILGLMYSDGEVVEALNASAINAYFGEDNGITTSIGPITSVDKSVIDNDKAEYWLIKAAKQGHKEAQFKLATLYNKARIKPKDTQRGQVYWLSEAGNNNHTEAQYLLGTMYDSGDGVMENDQQALFWFTKAANLGLANAQYKVGIMHANSQGLPPSPQNDKAAISWLQNAAEQNHMYAQFALASMYESGKGTPRDIMQAIALYKRSAEQGHLEAATALREAEQYIATYKQDFLAAANEHDYREFLKAYGHDNIDDFIIPIISDLLKNQDSQDYIAARNAAAQNGNIQANLDIGKGHLKPLDLDGARKAIPFLETASTANNKEASILLGIASFITDNKANPRLITSAEEGDAESQYFLAKAYEEGLGVDQNMNNARTWYEKSSLQGHSNAAIALNAVSEKIVQREKELAIQKAEQEKQDARLAAEQARQERAALLARIKNKENDLKISCSRFGSPIPSQICMAETTIKIYDNNGRVRVSTNQLEANEIGTYDDFYSLIIPLKGKFSIRLVHTFKNVTLRAEILKPDGSIHQSEIATTYEPIHLN